MTGMFRTLVVAAVAFVAVAAPACADPQKVRAAIDAMDVEALRREAAADGDTAQKLASAVEQSWMAYDDATAVALADAIEAQTDPSLKAAGLRSLMSYQMRRGAFAAAAETGAASAAFEPLAPSEQQALAFLQALVGVAPTRAIGDPSGRVAVKRDLAGLMRGDISVGDQSVAAILDTGANFSTINETSAQRLGLRMLESAVSVASSSRDAVASRLGVADQLAIGGAQFSNVIFIVLPDADLSFANGAYTIDAILGMPVFFEMKRIQLTKAAGAEEFVFGEEAADVGDAERNILFGGMSPIVTVNVAANDDEADVMMLLDSGAQRTSFSSGFADAAPAIMQDAETVTSTRGGAGGMVTSDKTKRIASLAITAGDYTAQLKNVDVHNDGQDSRMGILGLDAFGTGFVIDWEKGVLDPGAPEAPQQ